MSLRVTSNNILIENAAGTTKFDSGDRLVVRSGVKTGSTTIGTSSLSKVLNHGLTYDDDDYFYTLFIKITACAGNGVEDLINVRIPANNQLLVHFDAPLHTYAFQAYGTQAIAYSTTLSTAVSSTQLIFTYGTHQNGAAYPNDGDYRNPQVSISFNYELYVYRYLV